MRKYGGSDHGGDVAGGEKCEALHFEGVANRICAMGVDVKKIREKR